MFQEVKNCQDVIRDNFNKPLKMTARDSAILKRLLVAIFVKKDTKTKMKE